LQATRLVRQTRCVPVQITDTLRRQNLPCLSLPFIQKSPEGSVGSSRRAVSGEDEAGELRAGPAERAARAGHGPSAGHRPGGGLLCLVRGGGERAVAYLRSLKPADEPGPRSSMVTSSSPQTRPRRRSTRRRAHHCVSASTAVEREPAAVTQARRGHDAG
jgi:hypothetical protein